MINSDCDWEAIRNAFPLSPINLDQGISLRPLQLADLDALCLFMTGDPEMTWPRTSWARSNVEYLLEFRLKHYQNYGFGPYGVLLDGRLIGMAGVQVWEETTCSIELLVYLAKEVWLKGLGRKLLIWIIDAARSSGKIKEIYAATREDNNRAINLARRVGFQEFGKGIHFGHPAIKWIIHI